MSLASIEARPTGRYEGTGSRGETMRKLQAATAAVLLAVVGAACSSTSGKGPAVAARNIQVDATDKVLPLSRDHEGPALTVDKDDPNTVYLADSEMTTGECRFYV